jgi:hypothetical protein
MAKFADLVTYFENLAAKHVELRHTAAKKHFYRFELDEVLTALCRNINYPALILEAYDFNYTESRSDNVIKQRNGAFILIDKVTDAGDYNKIHEVWDKLEEIGNDILVKMIADKDSRLEPIIRDFDISASHGQPLMVEELGQYGMRFTFSLGSPVNNEPDETRWL